MNPIKWVRWKVVIVLAAVLGGFYFFGLDPLAKSGINALGATGAAGARFQVDGIGLGLLRGRTSIENFLLASPRKDLKEADKEKVMSAVQVVADLGMDDLLRKRFAMDEVGLITPRLSLQRRPDGTINIEDLGGPPEEEEPSGEPTDWVKTITEWAEKLRKRIEERQKKESEEKKEKSKPPEQKGMRADYSLAATYPFENQPGALVRNLYAKAMEITFDDQAGGLEPPPITEGEIAITNLSDRPDLVQEPIGLEIRGKIDGAPIGIKGTIDLRRILSPGVEPQQKNLINLRVTATGLSLQKVVSAFAGKSLDVTFEGGTADVNAEINLENLERLTIRDLDEKAPLFSLKDVKLQAKPGSKIAGIDGQQFAAGVNEVGRLDVKGLEVGGTLKSPVFKWPDMKTLLAESAKAAAAKQLDKGLQKGAAEAGKLIDEKLGGNPQLKGALEKALPKSDLKKAAGGLLDGVLGGKKDTSEK